MRIISGNARGLKLNTPSPDMTIRPTGERVKEALFSAIQFDIRGCILDLFAGTGQLGLEAASRGAEHVVFCDNDRRSVELIKSNVQKTNCESFCEVLLIDYKRYLKHDCNHKFDIVFIDPPYNQGLSDKALTYLGEDGHMLNNGAIVILECDSTEKKPEIEGVLTLKKRYIYTNVSFLIYVKGETDE